MIRLVIFSHSDYCMLWKIIEDYIKDLGALDPIFVCDRTTLPKPKHFKEYIEYDEKRSYFSRWLYDILPHIQTEYILIVHDVNIILHCDIQFITKIAYIMKEHQIDRCSLNVFKGSDRIDMNDISLCNLQTAIGKTYTIYDVCPALWNTDSFRKLVSVFPYESYRNSEQNQELISFCRNHYKTYGIQKTDENIFYCLGRPYTNHFKILHITTQSEITYPIDVYMDSKDDFQRMAEMYNLTDRIKINHNYHFILSNFTPL